MENNKIVYQSFVKLAVAIAVSQGTTEASAKKIITKKMVMNFIEELELIWDTWEIMLIIIPIIVYQLFKK